MCGRAVYCRKKLAYVICEGFNKEIFMVSEYKCIRCFISKNIVGGKGIIQLVREHFCVLSTLEITLHQGLCTLYRNHISLLYSRSIS